MASCSKCAYYSETIDELQRNFNDVGPTGNHYCPMYPDAIPDGVFNGPKDCVFFDAKEE